MIMPIVTDDIVDRINDINDLVDLANKKDFLIREIKTQMADAATVAEIEPLQKKLDEAFSQQSQAQKRILSEVSALQSYIEICI